jgi:putative flippase GtrA
MPRWALFLFAGAANTIVSYIVYLLGKQFFDYNIAYLFAYASGIVLSYFMNAAWVFRTPLSWSGFFKFPIVYIAQYAISAVFLNVLVEKLNIVDTFAPLLVTAATLPITYAMSKVVLMKTRHKSFGPRKLNKNE